MISMNKRIYEITLSESTSVQNEQQQTKFMGGAFDLANASNLLGHGLEIVWTNADGTQAPDDGHGLWYICQNHTNHRFRDHDGDLYIYDDLDVAIAKANALGWHGGCSPISVSDYMRKYGRYMDAEDGE